MNLRSYYKYRDCYSANRPVELIEEWNNDGWRVDTKYYYFDNYIITSDYMSDLLELQPDKDATFNKIGRGNTGYWFDATEEMFKLILDKSLKINNSDDILEIFRAQVDTRGTESINELNESEKMNLLVVLIRLGMIRI